MGEAEGEGIAATYLLEHANKVAADEDPLQEESTGVRKEEDREEETLREER